MRVRQAHHRAFLEWDKPPANPKRRYKIRRRRRYIFDEEEHKWKNIDKPKVVPKPSNDANDLFLQIKNRPKVDDVLKFLAAAVQSPIFDWSHVYATVTTLAKKKRWMDQQESLEIVRESTALRDVVQKGVAILEARDPSEPLKDPDRMVVLLRATAELADEAPQLHSLASALGVHLCNHIGDVKKRNVVYMLWSIAQLRAYCPNLQDELLPRILSYKDFRAIRQSIRTTLKLEGAYLWNAFVKLKQDVPELREFLPPT